MLAVSGGEKKIGTERGSLKKLTEGVKRAEVLHPRRAGSRSVGTPESESMVGQVLGHKEEPSAGVMGRIGIRAAASPTDVADDAGPFGRAVGAPQLIAADRVVATEVEAIPAEPAPIKSPPARPWTDVPEQ